MGTDTPLQVSEDEGGDEDDAYDGDASDGYGSDSGEGTSDEDSGYSSDGAPARRNGAASDGNSSDPPGLVDASVRAPSLAAALGAANCVCGLLIRMHQSGGSIMLLLAELRCMLSEVLR